MVFGTADAKTDLQEGKTMTSSASAAISETGPLPATETQLTLLELVSAISEMTASDTEVTEAVLSLLRSGRVRLCGNFKGEPIENFES